MRAKWGGAFVGAAYFAVGVMGLEGGSARAQAVDGGSPAPGQARPAGIAAPRPLAPGTFPAATAPGVEAAPARVAAPAVPTAPGAVGDGATLTGAAPAGVDTGTDAATGGPSGTAPAAGSQSYFRSELPPSPPSRLERIRQRVRGFVHRSNGDEGSEDHRYIDPSTGRTNQPISRPWLTPTR